MRPLGSLSDFDILPGATRLIFLLADERGAAPSRSDYRRLEFDRLDFRMIPFRQIFLNCIELPSSVRVLGCVAAAIFLIMWSCHGHEAV
jgi:hypothetical protein